ALKQLITAGALTAESLQRLAPHLSRTVAPVWLASPYEIDQVSDTMPIDVVILVDAGATTLAENVGAIRRARQVLVFGDPVTQTPAPFRIGLDEGEESPVAVAYPSARASMPVRGADGDEADAVETADADDADAGDFDTPPAAATQSAGGAPAAATQSAGGAPAAATQSAGGTPAAPEQVDDPPADDLHARSAFAQLASVLPVLSLTRSYRAGGEDL